MKLTKPAAVSNVEAVLNEMENRNIRTNVLHYINTILPAVYNIANGDLRGGLWNRLWMECKQHHRYLYFFLQSVVRLEVAQMIAFITPSAL